MGITNSNKQINADRIDCEGALKVTLALAAAPRQFPAPHRQRIADLVICDRRAVEIRKQVAPHAVPVRIRDPQTVSFILR